MRHGLKALTASLTLAIGLSPASSFAKNITLTFNEVDFGTNGNIVDPLPNDAYASYGILMSNFYWGTDMRDPFGLAACGRRQGGDNTTH